MKERLRIIVGGLLGLTPGGGVAWDYVQWPLGLAQLGHDVLYIEDTRLWPIYENGAADSSPTVARIRSAMEGVGLGSRWAYRDELSGHCFGRPHNELLDFCRSADIFLNISCSTVLRDEYHVIPVRALVDTDPMFTQVQFANDVSFTSSTAGMRKLFAGHTHFFSFGEHIGQPDCRIPHCGVTWHRTRQPICLSQWDATPIPSTSAFTTLMNWTAARDLQFQGDTWGQKNVSLMQFLDLPQAMHGVPLAIAVGQTSGAPFPAELFRTRGWIVMDPEQCAPDWRSYRTFLSGSQGEFSVAKQTYVKARSGWFSCRSACYLASGRPVIAQETGWSSYIPAGHGLLSFTDMEGAVAALRTVTSQPHLHARAARDVAEEYFAAGKVLSAMLDKLAA